MSRISEPHVNVTEQIAKAPSLSEVTNILTVGGVIVSKKGRTGLNRITSPNQFLEEYCIDGKLNPDDHTSLLNAYRMSQTSELIISRSVGNGVLSAAITKPYTTFPVIDGNALKSSTEISLQIGTTSNGKYIRYNNFYLVQSPGDYSEIVTVTELANVNSATSIPVKLVYSTEEQLTSILNKIYDIGVYFETEEITAEETQIKVHHNYDIAIYGDFMVVGDGTEETLPEVSSTVIGEGVILTSKYSSSEVLLVKIERLSSTKIALTYAGTTYELSTDLEETNQYGVSIFYEYFNKLNLPFYVSIDNLDDHVIGEIDVISFDLSPFGGVNDMTSVPSLVDALNVFYDQEEYLLDLFCDFNITNTSFQSTMQVVAENNKAMPVFSIPTEYVNTTLAINYRNSTGILTNKAHFTAPNDLTTNLGFRAVIGSSVLYCEIIARNKSINIEFAPAMGPNNGRPSVSNLIRKYNKTEREDLINAQINPIRFDRGLIYFDDNRTATTEISVLNEEHNRRFFNRINRDVSLIMKQFIGEQNNLRTRLKVESVLRTYFNTYIMVMDYRPEEFMIVCDKSNNEDTFIRDNKLGVTISVRLLGAIKFIEVLNKAYPVGIAF